MKLFQWLFGPRRYGWVIHNKLGPWSDKVFESEETARIYVRSVVAPMDDDPRFSSFEHQFRYLRVRVAHDAIICTKSQATFILNSRIGEARAKVREAWAAAGLEPPERARL